MTDSEAQLGPAHTNNWSEPWYRLLVLMNILVREAVGSILIVVLMSLVENVMNTISIPPWVWSIGFSFAGVIRVEASDIVHYGDLAVFLGFLVAGGYDVVNWMKSR